MIVSGGAIPFSMLAARAVVAGSALGLISLAALHILKPEVHPSRNMISLYALGRHGWIMALCSLRLPRPVHLWL